MNKVDRKLTFETKHFQESDKRQMVDYLNEYNAIND